MPSLREVAREMIRIGGPEIGYLFNIASLTATTATVAALANGEAGHRFDGKILVRRDAASPPLDRQRRIARFVSTTGAFSTAGANYTDTTATSEVAEIYGDDPFMIDYCINEALVMTRRHDVTMIPGRPASDYYIGDLDWIEDPSVLIPPRVERASNPVLTRNRGMEKWNIVDADTAAATAVPDFWTLAGAGATCVRSTTRRTGRCSAAITRAGTDCTLRQGVGGAAPSNIISLLSAGAESLRGKTVGIAGMFLSPAANAMRIQVTDGSSTASSSYHAGASAWQELSSESFVVSATATHLDVLVSIETTNGTYYVDDLYMFYGAGLNDAIRLGEYASEAVSPSFSQNSYPMTLILPKGNFGMQYLVHSQRGYVPYGAEQVRAGTADAQSVDAPLKLIATGALWRLFKKKSEEANGSALEHYETLTKKWARLYKLRKMKHLHEDQQAGGGYPLLPASFRNQPQRFG